MADEVRCRSCHKTLKVHESIVRGIGPECSRREASLLQTEMEMFDPEEVLNAMTERTKEVQAVKCPGCGYKCLKPEVHDPWHKSECIICKLSGQTYIYDL